MSVRETATASAKQSRRSIRHELEGLSIVVCVPRDEQCDLLLRDLQQLRVQTRHLWPLPATIPSDADVIFCEYCPDLVSRLPWLPGSSRTALVVVLPQIEHVDIDALSNATPNSILARPLTHNAIFASLALAHSQFLYERRLQAKVERLEDNLRSMRSVERGKSILMTTRKMSDEDAYSFIRRQAMDRRVQVSVIADAIIDSFELIGYTPKK